MQVGVTPLGETTRGWIARAEGLIKVVADADNIVTGFIPKGHTTPSWHFVGIQVVNKSVFAPLPMSRPIPGRSRTRCSPRCSNLNAFRPSGGVQPRPFSSNPAQQLTARLPCYTG